MPSKIATKQIDALLNKGMTFEQIADVTSVALGTKVTAKQVRTLIDAAKDKKPSGK